MENRDYYKVLLVGASGKGKTYSFKDMDVNTTGFINVENKPLPFKNAYKFHKRITTYYEVLETLIEYARNPEIKCIVVDSFSAYSDLVLQEMRKTKKGLTIVSSPCKSYLIAGKSSRDKHTTTRLAIAYVKV